MQLHSLRFGDQRRARAIKACLLLLLLLVLVVIMLLLLLAILVGCHMLGIRNGRFDCRRVVLDAPLAVRLDFHPEWLAALVSAPANAFVAGV